MAIAGMILVNNPGDWGKTFKPLLHADWHGWTVTDLIYPFFLFVMGVAIPLAQSRRLELYGDDRFRLYRGVFRRTLIILGLGLLLNWFPFFGIDWANARLPGVLQRIAIVYFFASLAGLHLSVRSRAWLITALLGGYWIAMKLVPVPGFGAGDLSPAGNLAGYVDGVLLGSHVWAQGPGPGDPDGILSTVPAIGTALIGLLTGEWLRSARKAREKLYGLAVSGTVGIAAGLLLDQWFPINKSLWSSSYVLFTAGMALVALAGIYYLVDIRGWDRWAGPFYVFGMNSIAAFVGSGLLARFFIHIRWTGTDEGVTSLQRWLYQTCVEPALPDYWASLAWATANVVFWLGVMGLLYRRRVFLRV